MSKRADERWEAAKYSDDDISKFEPITDLEIEQFEQRARKRWPTFWLIPEPPKRTQEEIDALGDPTPDDFRKFTGKDMLRVIQRLREAEATS